MRHALCFSPHCTGQRTYTGISRSGFTDEPNFMKGIAMKVINAFLATTFSGAMLFAASAIAQSPGNSYYDSTPWPLPGEGGTSAFRLTGMTSAHAVWMSFTQYVGGKPMMDSEV